jgi:hypothetical protein
MFMDAVAAEPTHLRCPRVRSATEGRRAKRTRCLRAVTDDVCEEGLEEELTRGQPFDDAHARATALTRPRAREYGANRRCGNWWGRRDGQDRTTRREIVGAARRRMLESRILAGTQPSKCCIRVGCISVGILASHRSVHHERVIAAWAKSVVIQYPTLVMETGIKTLSRQ